MTSYLQNRKPTGLKFCIRHAFMAIMTHAKFCLNRLTLTLIFVIRASEPPPRARRTTEKAGPDRVNRKACLPFNNNSLPSLLWLDLGLVHGILCLN